MRSQDRRLLWGPPFFGLPDGVPGAVRQTLKCRSSISGEASSAAEVSW